MPVIIESSKQSRSTLEDRIEFKLLELNTGFFREEDNYFTFA